MTALLRLEPGSLVAVGGQIGAVVLRPSRATARVAFGADQQRDVFPFELSLVHRCGRKKIRIPVDPPAEERARAARRKAASNLSFGAFPQAAMRAYGSVGSGGDNAPLKPATRSIRCGVG